MALLPTAEQIKRLAEEANAGPVVMLNLLKFADPSATAGPLTDPDWGGRFAELGRELLESTGGRILWSGRGNSVVIGDETDAWDAAILVEHPSRAAFVKMITSPKYREFSEMRAVMLADQRILAITQEYRLTDGAE